MKLQQLATGALAMASLASLAGVAQARNPHCAGGIQYYSQAMTDKSKQNVEDYQREIGKAVVQLSQCSSEDPNDLEALGYLGMAFAEVDSCDAAGQAFEKALAGMKAKGDKKYDWVATNRQSYWVGKFNAGIDKIRTAQAIYPDLGKAPATDQDKQLHEQAMQNLTQAEVTLGKAAQLKPNDAMTLSNLSVAYAMAGDVAKAKAIVDEGLKALPGDTLLVQRQQQYARDMAGKQLSGGNYDEAIATFSKATQANAKDADAWSSLGDAYFQKAQKTDKDDAAKKGDYKSAGDAYSKGSAAKGGDPDMSFNAAVAYSNAGAPVLAVPMWKATIDKRPDDKEAMSGLGSNLADLGKYDEGASWIKKALALQPDDKNFHRQLGGIYARANNQQESTKELMLFLAMDKGSEVTKVTAPGGSAEAQTMTSEGAPEKIYQWDADGQKYETLAYFKKGRAYTFKGGTLVMKSDWGAAGATTGANKK